MIIPIDQSPDWKRPRTTSPDWARLLEALFLHCPDRRPASRLEVLLLSRALRCPEVLIERHRAPAIARLLPVDPIRRTLHSHNPGLNRVPDKVGNIMRAEFGHNPAAMELHGLHRNV
jgi:hypothetical protein